ncbi:hypothetical protein EXS70_03210 [Candidatus Peribacteria bacterium]|nr:hypothetical protein [Candidatus Peribacteria bacterium]
MKKLSARSVVLFVASLVMGTTLPLAVGQSFNAYAVGDRVIGSDGSTVRLHRAAITTQERMDFYNAIDIYSSYLQQGRTDLIKPNINDRASIRFYLMNPGTGKVQSLPKVTDPLSTKEYMKPEADVSPVDELNKQERAALLRSEKVGKCWSYPGFSKNYYTLCQKFIKGKQKKNTTGIQTDLIYTRSTGRRFLFGDSKPEVTMPLTTKGYQYISSARAVPSNVRSASSK